MGGRDHEDALAAPSPDQLRERDADLQRLAQTDHVGDQQPGLRVAHGQRQLGGAQLMLLPVHEEGVGKGYAVFGLRQRGLPYDRLQMEAGFGVFGSVVGREPGLARIEHLDHVQPGVEDRIRATDERGNAADLDHESVTGLRDGLHEPLLVSDADLRAGGEDRPDADRVSRLPGIDVAPLRNLGLHRRGHVVLLCGLCS
ncbi:hypothetical protein ACFVRD_33280 [Streptomyces sp. NPDC057908]|uniref:hypothetical protein n=1 Tax=Streptomyces sp. NPDC057908 TaxID=3346276 RepID=UPI0036F0EB23